MNYPKKRYTGEKPWMNYNWLYNQYVIEDKSTKEISNEYGCKQNTIQQWLLKHKIKKKITTHKMKIRYNYQKKDYLYNEHIVNKKPIAVIARENNVSGDTIRRYLQKYNIDIWYTHGKIVFSDDDIKTIVSLYFDDKLSAYAISKFYKCSHKTIIGILQKLGFETRNRQAAQLTNKESSYNLLLDSDFLYEKYIIENRSITELSKMLDLDKNTIRRQLAKFDIKVKPKNKRAINYKLKELGYDVDDCTLIKFPIREYFKIHQAPKALKRDGYKCVCCGITESLNVHHIYPLSSIILDVIREHPELNSSIQDDRVKLYNYIKDNEKFLDTNNLETLCEKCHKKIHKKDNQQPRLLS